jgi:hypothetical protein
MPNAEQHDVISLTVLRQDGNLAVSLTDSRSIARLGICVLPDALATDLQRETQEVLAWCADYGLGKVSGSAAAAGVRRLGRRVFDALLPGPVASFLRGTSDHTISLQLETSLAWVPWEIAFDGEQFLGEKFALCRQILAEEQAPRWQGPAASGAALNVLVLVGDLHHLEDRSGPQRLIDQLRDVEGLEVISANARDLLHDELLELIGKSHVVHHIGPLGGRRGSCRQGRRRAPGGASGSGSDRITADASGPVDFAEHGRQRIEREPGVGRRGVRSRSEHTDNARRTGTAAMALSLYSRRIANWFRARRSRSRSA